MKIETGVLVMAHYRYRVLMVPYWLELKSSHFRSSMEITNKQWSRYLATGRLRVTPRSCELLKAMGALQIPTGSKHAYTILKAFEAKHDTKLLWK